MKSFLPLLLPALLLAGCSTFKKDKQIVKDAEADEVATEAVERATPVRAPKYVGEIASVNPEAHFVLVDITGFQAPEAGAELEVLKDGKETCRMKVGDQVRRPFAVADILSGEPQIGDSVWLRRE